MPRPKAKTKKTQRVLVVDDERHADLLTLARMERMDSGDDIGWQDFARAALDDYRKKHRARIDAFRKKHPDK